MLGDINPTLHCDVKGKDFSGCDVPNIVRFGESCHGQPAVSQADGGLGPGATLRRAFSGQEAQIRRRLGLAVDRIRGLEQCRKAHECRNGRMARSQEGTARISPESQRPGARRIGQGHQKIEIMIGLSRKDALANGAFDQYAPSAIGTAILNPAEGALAVESARAQRK